MLSRLFSSGRASGDNAGQHDAARQPGQQRIFLGKNYIAQGCRVRDSRHRVKWPSVGDSRPLSSGGAWNFPQPLWPDHLNGAIALDSRRMSSQQWLEHHLDRQSNVVGPERRLESRRSS